MTQCATRRDDQNSLSLDVCPEGGTSSSFYQEKDLATAVTVFEFHLANFL